MPGLEMPRARRARDVAVGLVAGAMIAGSLFSTDDAWPFAPFRMFASAPTRSVKTLALDAVFADGELRRMPAERFHLRRAELEGQRPRIVAEPDLLGALVRGYNDRLPDRRIVELRLVERRSELVGGRPARGKGGGRHGGGPPDDIEWTVRVLARWRAP